MKSNTDVEIIDLTVDIVFYGPEEPIDLVSESEEEDLVSEVFEVSDEEDHSESGEEDHSESEVIEVPEEDTKTRHASTLHDPLTPVEEKQAEDTPLPPVQKPVDWYLHPPSPQPFPSLEQVVIAFAGSPGLLEEEEEESPALRVLPPRRTKTVVDYSMIDRRAKKPRI